VSDEWIDGPPPETDGVIAAGILVEFADGEQSLIGHVNQMNGVCDDCTPDNDIRNAVRHKVVWRA
jgi:hypothetical protein